jgi:X-Pro dipeptidyl-peptidase (S15 family)
MEAFIEVSRLCKRFRSARGWAIARFVRISRATTLVALAVVAAAACSRPAGAPAARGAFQSHYVPMPDGVRLAVDVWLPAGTTAGARLPAVLVTARYWRQRESSPGMAAPWIVREARQRGGRVLRGRVYLCRVLPWCLCR